MELIKGICPLCPPYLGEQYLISGQCRKHYWQGIKLKSAERKGQRTTLTRRVSTTGRNKFISEKSDGLQVYFDHHDSNTDWLCENCHRPVPHYNRTVRKSAHAHILPKNLFPSVASHLSNHLLLGGLFSDCSCHKAYDTSWDRASRMPVFEIAKVRLLEFAHLISPQEYKNIPDVLLTHLKENNVWQ